VGDIGVYPGVCSGIVRRGLAFPHFLLGTDWPCWRSVFCGMVSAGVSSWLGMSGGFSSFFVTSGNCPVCLVYPWAYHFVTTQIQSSSNLT
jgi:hypothetical protein